MTPEQLDEIEAQINEFGEESGFILPLVKALREARALKQQWAADADAKEALLQSVAKACRGMKEPDEADLSVLGNVLRERDEARAELVARDERHFKVLEQYRLEVEDYRRRTGDLLDRLAKVEADAHQFVKERDVARARLSNLLARIHRDGGHYEAKNGTAKAVVDADVTVAQVFAERDEARAEVERLKQSVATLDKLYVSRTDELRESEAEVERLNKRLESEQHFIDSVCHYRNLAIVLGAKPEQMLGKFDRELCEGGIDPDDTSGGYHVSVNQQLDELKDVWAEVERLREAARQVHALAEKALGEYWTVGIAAETFREIHKITKGMVK